MPGSHALVPNVRQSWVCPGYIVDVRRQHVPDLARVLDGRDRLELRNVAVPNRPRQRRRLVRARVRQPAVLSAWRVHRSRSPSRSSIAHARRDTTLTWTAVTQLNSNGQLLPTANITFAAANLTSYSYVDATHTYPCPHYADGPRA